MADVHQRRRGHKDDLEHPQADVGDGEGLVIAHVLASRLLRVANIVGLLVAPHELCRRAQYEDAEDEQHCEPHPADHRGVLTQFETVPPAIEPTLEAGQKQTISSGKDEEELCGCAAGHLDSP
uniref:Uncharacterized protein n=2 Tax=Poecilia TaxID=8080 RepID=A0A3B3VYP0_9TELE